MIVIWEQYLDLNSGASRGVQLNCNIPRSQACIAWKAYDPGGGGTKEGLVLDVQVGCGILDTSDLVFSKEQGKVSVSIFACADKIAKSRTKNL